MTDHGQRRRHRRRDRRRWRRPGPISTFALLVIAVAGALLALQATGAVAPQVHAGNMSGGGDLGSGRSYYVSEIINDGTLPVRILSAAWPVNGMDDAIVLMGPPGSSSIAPEPAPPVSWADQSVPFRPITLQGGERRLVYLVVRPHCSPTEQSTRVRSERLRLRARSGFGPTRAISIERTDQNHDMNCATA